MARAPDRDAYACCSQRELWLPELCDVSMTLRSNAGLMLAGVRLPRGARPESPTRELSLARASR
jgi:hypothetical protein